MEELSDEISLLDILAFLRESWKFIVACGLAGVATAAAWLATVPSQFEANALIEMAQVPATTNGTSIADSTNLKSIESPDLLIERLRQPTTYTEPALAGCGLQFNIEAAAALASTTKGTVPPKLTGVVELTVRAEGPAVAAKCATAIFEMVREQQAEKINLYQAELRKSLADLQLDLRENQELLAKTSRTGVDQAAYLAKCDPTYFYLVKQKDLIRYALSGARPSRLLAPVYASSTPVAPKKRATLMLGTIAGLIFGVILAAGRRLKLRLMAKR